MKKVMLLLAVFGLAGSLYAADPFVGTWKLNVAKSKVGDPSIMPKSETIVVTEQQGVFKTAIDGVDAQGKAYHSESSGKWDGKDIRITGDPGADMISVKKIDTNTIAVVNKKAGKEVSTFRATISKDGKTNTLSGKMKDQEVTFDMVYDKQ